MAVLGTRSAAAPALVGMGVKLVRLGRMARVVGEEERVGRRGVKVVKVLFDVSICGREEGREKGVCCWKGGWLTLRTEEGWWR